MKRPRSHGLARKLADVLADAPRPMLLGELETELDFERRVAKAYGLAQNAFGM